MGWEKQAREKQRRNKHTLESLKDHWVIIGKWSVEAQEELARQRKSVELDKDGKVLGLQGGEMIVFHKTVIKHSILDHNFIKEDKTKEDFKDGEFLDRLLGFPEVEEEIFSLAMGLNRPLAVENESQSETAQNGSSTEPNSKLERRSRTVESHQKN